MDITLARQNNEEISDEDRLVVRRVLFGIINGLGEQNQRRWNRFVNGLLRLEPGEIVYIKTSKSRDGVFHRRHMLLEQRLFEAQEKFEDFEQFRIWLKVGAGHVDWVGGGRGGSVPVPIARSISYDRLEDDEMREFHENLVRFVRGERAQKTLWKHLTVMQRHEMVESILTDLKFD